MTPVFASSDGKQSNDRTRLGDANSKIKYLPHREETILIPTGWREILQIGGLYSILSFSGDKRIFDASSKAQLQAFFILEITSVSCFSMKAMALSMKKNAWSSAFE